MDKKYFVPREVFRKLVENVKKKYPDLSDAEIVNNALESLGKKGYIVEAPLSKDEEIKRAQVRAGEEVITEKLRELGLVA